MKLKDLVSNNKSLNETSHEPEEEIKEYSLDLREEEDGGGEGLNRIINLRISDGQFKKIKNKATDEKTSVSDYIRGKLFK